jgi:hypothetical protein
MMINLLNIKKLDERFTVKRPWDLIILITISLLLTIPAFIIAHQNLVNLNLSFHIDRILLFACIFSSFLFILIKLRRITLLTVFGYFLLLIYGTILGGYGFKTVFDEYNSMLYTMYNNPYPQDIILKKLLPFPNKSKIENAVDYNNPKVRNFAIRATSKYFKHTEGYEEYRTIIQCFAVFKEINSNWNYVHDPKNKDYIASASESITYLSGDCDDHSILMAACIRSIGGTPRLIHTDGHIYPELLIGTKTDLETINYLIKNELFLIESKNQSIHYHIDERNQIWLNLDYTAKYPGGPFMSEEILGILNLE